MFFINLFISVSLFLLFALGSQATTTQITIEVSVNFLQTFHISGNPNAIDLLDTNHSHRYRMYINNQSFHTFETITTANSVVDGSYYKTTVTYSGQIPCDNVTPLNFEVDLESDLDSDALFDDFTSGRSAVYPFKINCLTTPQHFKLEM